MIDGLILYVTYKFAFFASKKRIYLFQYVNNNIISIA